MPEIKISGLEFWYGLDALVTATENNVHSDVSNGEIKLFWHF